MIKLWLDKEKCTGCGACVNICPVNAIEMVEDEFGFSYPCISNECIECQRCKKVCESRTDIIHNSSYKKVYSAWSKDEKIRFDSTSGGIFTEIARCIIEEGGCVVGAGYVDDNFVKHIIIESNEELYKIRQSKYVQSKIGHIYRDILMQLDRERKVLFCGSPCQVSGLKAFLQKEYSNLYTVDFICRGVNSPKAYREWLREIANKNDDEIKKVWFKYKEYGWKQSPLCTRIDLLSKDSIILDKDNNLYMRGYLEQNLFVRPSCGECDFKGLKHKADIVLADFWKVDKGQDDDKGTSMIIINSMKGKIIFEKFRNNINYMKRDLEEMLIGNPSYSNSVRINPHSNQFLKSLDNHNFSDAILPYLDSCEDLLIFGAGKLGKLAYHYYGDIEQKSVKGFIDNDKNKIGKQMCGVPVYAPDVLRERNYNVVIALKYYYDVIEQVRKYEKVKQIKLFQVDEIII